jgi:hypothetical protein
MKIFILPLVALFICSCSPRVIINSQISLQETKQNEGFLTLGLKDTFDTTTCQYLGEVTTKEGFFTDCSYTAVVKIAEAAARKLGGNVLKIVVHKVPSLTSDCHRITGKVYKTKDISRYEKQIVWNENRKLRQIDFKGSIENRPFEAATFAFFGYEYRENVFKGKIEFVVYTKFDCEKSYFKGTYQVDTVLAHEQGHFDIAELYARKFLKKVSEDAKSMRDFRNNIDTIYEEFTKEMFLEQDRYDSDIYPNREKQAVWLNNIQEELKKYDQYSNKQITIPK